MTAVPDEVSLDDLTDPVFPAEVVPIIEVMDAMADECPLEVDALLAAATTRTGLDDFGDPWFREPLEVLSHALRHEAGLSPRGQVSLHTQLVQFLVNRLRLTDLLARHPEIHDVAITAPIVIAGLPRTGTTHLHNLLSADPALRSLPYWESLEPVPDPAEPATGDEQDPRWQRTAAALDVMNAALPYFIRMHEMTVDHVHEEIALLAMDASTMFFETLALMPSYREWYRSTDQTPAYEHLATTLRALTWLRGGDRWVLKTPQHLEQFGPLATVFPDATFVVTHRDPVAITASMTAMLAYTARMQVAHPDLQAIGAYWSSRLEEMLLACTRDRDLLPADRSIDVRFDEFMADEQGTVAAIYALAGQPLDEPARQAMDDYVRVHPRGRHGRVRYDLAAFGIEPGERRRAFAPYVARFGVRWED